MWRAKVRHTGAAQQRVRERVADSRYARLELVDWWNRVRMADARVVVVGAGAVGNEVIKNLALMGAGHLLIVDFDTIELSNLTRSVLFRDGDVGKPKARVAAERAADLNPEVESRWIEGRLEFDLGLGILRRSDLVIGCLDSIQARLALNRLCRKAGVPWLNTGIELDSGEVGLYGTEPGPCYECGLSDEMWLEAGERLACSGFRSPGSDAPVPTTAPLSSLIGGLCVDQAVRMVHGQTAPQGLRAGQKLYVTLAPYNLYVLDLPRRQECLAHEVWTPVLQIPACPETSTAAGVLEESGRPGGQLNLGYDLITGMRCQRCGAVERIVMPLEMASPELTTCPECGAPSRAPDVASWLDAASDAAGLPLAALRLPCHQMFSITGGGEPLYVELASMPFW